MGVAAQGGRTSRQGKDPVCAKERQCLVGRGRRGFSVLLRGISIGWVAG